VSRHIQEGTPVKFNAREDIEAPITEVYAVLTDYAAFERAALRRGAEVTRADKGGRPAWQVSFRFRGKRREVAIVEDSRQPPSSLAFSGRGKLVEGTMTVDLMELGPRRTRMTVTTDVRPLTLAARLFLQSLKLARSRVTKRYQTRMAQFATLIEARTKGQGGGL
jgi:carbon monoxide dehydrogenase subunit G